MLHNPIWLIDKKLFTIALEITNMQIEKWNTNKFNQITERMVPGSEEILDPLLNQSASILDSLRKQGDDAGIIYIAIATRIEHKIKLFE